MRKLREAIVGVAASLVLCFTLALCGDLVEADAAQSHSRLRDADVFASQKPTHAPDELLVRFHKGVSSAAVAAAHARVGAKELRRFGSVPHLTHVKLPPGIHVKDAVNRYRRDSNVMYAEPNYRLQAFALPNDPHFGDLWGLHNTGQLGGTPDADIDAPEAWDLSTGSSDVVVAVIDTGIDYTHADLSANMFRNTTDCNTNGVDDDGNGFVDDCYGIDAVNNDSDPMDDHHHGTHVAGTIGAVGNNSIGVTGINWNVRLMACKFLDAYGSGWTSGAIDCLAYIQLMKDRGVNIIATNNSWGGGGFSQALLDAIETHRQRGILFIAAAGNDTLDNDTSPHYPSNYYLPNIISVAATTRTDDLAWFSNYGKRTVHLGAPGDEIMSTTPGNTYDVFSGTSMATPHVTGVAALLKAHDPGRDWRTIRNLILAGGDTIASVTDTVTQKRLNAQGALTCSSSTVLSRLLPIGTTITASVGVPIDLAALHINCASPNGDVTVLVNMGAQVITLLDDGLGSDQAAGDGIYSGQWTPPALGLYTLTFPGGDVVTVSILENYTVLSVPFYYRTITGTNLDLSDDSSARITSPFPILFGGGSFSDLFVSSNGNMNVTGSFDGWFNTPMPTLELSTLVAPFWDDLYPVPGSDHNVFWEVIGSAPNRELIVEWRDVMHFDCNDDSSVAVTFQIVFFEGRSDILFSYADTIFGGACAFADRGGSATVGTQVTSGLGTQFSFDTQSLNVNTALLWTLASTPPPAPDIKANGSDGPLTIPSGSTLTVTVALDPGSDAGANADWWVAATSPFGLYWYTLDQGWVRSDVPIRVYGGPLFALAPYTVLTTTGLPVGNYTLYFGVDLLMNGVLDWGQLHYDSVGVTIQ